METKRMSDKHVLQAKPPSKIIQLILFEISFLIGGSIYIVLSLLFARGGFLYYSAFSTLIIANVFGALGFAKRIRSYRQLALAISTFTLIVFLIVVALIGTELLQPQTNAATILMDSLLMMVWVAVSISMVGRYTASLMTTKQ